MSIKDIYVKHVYNTIAKVLLRDIDLGLVLKDSSMELRQSLILRILVVEMGKNMLYPERLL